MKKTKEYIQKESLKKLLENDRGTAALSMGVGKTYLGLQYINHFYKKSLRVLVVAPKISIIQNWKDEIVKFKLKKLLDNITFSTYLSLSKQTEDYDIIILDECHNLLYSHDEYLNKHDGKILGLTGTPPRHNSSEKGAMVQKYCPVQYKYALDQAVNDSILNDYQIIIHNLPLSTEKNIEIVWKDSVFCTSEVNSYEYWTKRLENAATQKQRQHGAIMRMKAMMDFPSKLNYAHELLNAQSEKCILFCNTQKQADALCSHSYHSKNSDSDDNLLQFKSGEINKLSCVLQLSEGVSIPNLKVGIIIHSYGNEKKSAQRIGRLVRLNPKEKSVIHILCYEDTIDERWVKEALQDFDQNKIKYLN